MVLRKAFRADPDYARTWHDNIAMAYYDSSGPVEADSNAHAEQLRTGNEAASRFMKLCFNVETGGVADLIKEYGNPPSLKK